VKPIEIACRKCAQQPGENCILETNQGRTVKLVFFHAERIEDADAFATTDAPVSAEEFTAALERTNLI
jgi:hypothetical protein